MIESWISVHNSASTPRPYNAPQASLGQLGEQFPLRILRRLVGMGRVDRLRCIQVVPKELVSTRH
jgi:hypothetical protein